MADDINDIENTTWVIITPEDTCAWELKEAPIEGKPSFDEVSMYVGGLVEKIPDNWLMRGLHTMYVNEEGKLKKLPRNLLASRFLDDPVPIVGNAVIQWDNKYNDEEAWRVKI
tara:strand:- start:10336 stop:10674 length:339 start_codon:yes stop_codon:yes gene_type:complete